MSRVFVTRGVRLNARYRQSRKPQSIASFLINSIITNFQQWRINKCLLIILETHKFATF